MIYNIRLRHIVWTVLIRWFPVLQPRQPTDDDDIEDDDDEDDVVVNGMEEDPAHTDDVKT